MPTIKTTKRRPWQGKKRAMFEGRKESNMEFYNSAVWRQLAANKRAINPLCEVSQAAGRTVAGEMVDHIIPINQGGSALDTRNLMTLSHKIHNRKSGMERHLPILVDYKKNKAGEKIPANRNDIIKLLNSKSKL